MKKVLLACCLCLSLPLASFALEKSKTLTPDQVAKIKSLAADFYFRKSIKSQTAQSRSLTPLPPVCEPQPTVGACVDAACKHLPSYACDDMNEIREISAACANNRAGQCVDTACSHMPSYNCDDRSEIIEIAKACSGSEGSCLAAACKHMPSYNCDDRSEIVDLAKNCAGLVDGGCVDSVCAKMPSYSCDDTSEIKQVIQACKGN